MKILSKQDFKQNESENFVIDNLSEAPLNPIIGQIYYNTTDKRAYVYDSQLGWLDISLEKEVLIETNEPTDRDAQIWINPNEPIYKNSYDALPVGSIIDYSGTTVPEGYEEVPDPSVYSTEEKVIGTWIDGKPIYRKTFYLTGSNSSTSITSLNTDKVWVDVSASYITWQVTSTQKRVCPVSILHVGSSACANIGFQANVYIKNESGLFIIIESGSGVTLTDNYITIKYTKTTD